ncbi:MAG: hypothetical protein AAFZ15_17295 [Bacteroidota bacterium]
MANSRKRRTRKATKIKYTTQSCGHTKNAAASKVKALHKDGYTARKKKSADGKGWCVQKGRKRK